MIVLKLYSSFFLHFQPYLWLHLWEKYMCMRMVNRMQWCHLKYVSKAWVWSAVFMFHISEHILNVLHIPPPSKSFSILVSEQICYLNVFKFYMYNSRTSVFLVSVAFGNAVRPWISVHCNRLRLSVLMSIVINYILHLVQYAYLGMKC